MILYQLIYALLCVPFAYLNAKWIAKGRRILHGCNGLVHLVAAGIAWHFFGLKIAIAVLCNVAVVFDISLNLFRGLSIDYVSPKPKAIKDRVEKFLFGNNGLIPKIIYLGISIALNII